MTARHMAASVVAPPEPSRKYFTLDEANRCLAYVRRVVEDLTACYARVLEIRHDIENPAADQAVEQLEMQYEQAMQRLGVYVDELNLVGVELKDFEKGLLDFPSVLDGREILLCWKLGEERIAAWHEVDAGYKGRQDVSLLVRQGQ